MASPSSSISSGISVEPNQTSKLLSVLAEFLIRRRILLSAILFGLLIGEDLAFGTKPHDLVNVRDPWSVLRRVAGRLGTGVAELGGRHFAQERGTDDHGPVPADPKSALRRLVPDDVRLLRAAQRSLQHLVHSGTECW